METKTVTIKTYEAEIKQRHLPLLQESIDKVNKNLVKYNIPEVKILQKLESSYYDHEKHRDVDTFKLVLSHPTLIHNGREVTYVGTISFDGGIKKIHNVDERFVLGALDVKTLTCDHCHKALPRTKWSFFVEEGKLIHIGSTCSKDYFGVSVERLLDFWTFVSELKDKNDEEGYGYGGRSRPSASFKDLLAAILLTTHDFEGGYVSKANSNESKPSTANLVMGWLFPYFRGMGEIEKQAFLLSWDAGRTKAGQIIDEVKSLLLALPPPQNDFDWNLFEALFHYDGEGVTVLNDFVSFFGPAIYGIYKTWVDAHKPALVDDDKVKNEHFGKEGERLVLTGLRVVFSQFREGDFGVTHIIGFEDSEGRLFKSFYSGSDEYKLDSVYNLKGTVKGHNNYKGRRETVLSRIAYYVEKKGKKS